MSILLRWTASAIVVRLDIIRCANGQAACDGPSADYRPAFDVEVVPVGLSWRLSSA